MNRRFRWHFQWYALWFLVVIAPFAYSGGKKESAISRADNYIKEKRYDAAISALVEAVEEDAERFDAAQKRVRAIFRLRDDYHRLADELLDTLERDPENTELILAISKQIDALDSSRNSAVRGFLGRTLDLAQLTVNRKRLERILAEGRTRIEQGDYTGALEEYAGGLDIYQEEFFQGGYGDSVETITRNGIATLEGGVRSMADLTAAVDPAITALEEQSAQADLPDPNRPAALYTSVESRLEEIIAIHEALLNVGDYFNQQAARNQETDESQKDRLFFTFVGRLVSSPAGQDAQEGMLGVVTAYWEREVTRIEDALLALAERYYSGAQAQAREERFQDAISGYDQALRYTELSRRPAEQWSRVIEAEGQGVRLFDITVPEARVEEELRRESLSAAITGLKAAGALGARYHALDHDSSAAVEAWRLGNLSAELGSEQQRRAGASYYALEEEARSLREEISKEEERLAASSPLAGEVSGGISFMEDVRRAVEALESAVLTEERNFAAGAYAIESGEFEKHLATRESELNEAVRLIEGTVQPLAGEGSLGESYTVRYPAEGLAVLERLDWRLTEDTALGEELLARFEGEPPRIGEYETINDMRLLTVSLAERLKDYRNRGAALAAAAHTLITRAAALRAEGDRAYQEARDALARNSFETARERLIRAGARYDESLAIQESASLRDDRDTRLAGLGAEIARAENESIVREVRTLVNNARNTYFAGNFESAQDTLVRAQARWRITNVEDDPEITYWLTVIRGAVSLQSGRSIPITAPLYPEMSQLLSDARRIYGEGVNLLDAGRRGEGLAKFTEARQKTREVRLMFPLNQDASLLEMRIEQVTDPAIFNEAFQRRFNEAVAGAKRRSVEAFADLQNLAEINPRYPGISAALYQAELDMGYRLPPPDPASLARSNELTAQARATINRNVRAEFPIALEQLNQALALDPNNSQAMAEKDRVQTLLGGSGVALLSNAAERQYQRAVQELQQGNTVVALAIVQQLLQDPQNQNSTRLAELQRRIESVL